MHHQFAVGDKVAHAYTPSQIGTITDIETSTTWGDTFVTCTVALDCVFGCTHAWRLDARQLLPATPGYIDAMTPGPYGPMPVTLTQPRIRLRVQPFALVGCTL
jgi:hypothetical protein